MRSERGPKRNGRPPRRERSERGPKRTGGPTQAEWGPDRPGRASRFFGNGGVSCDHVAAALPGIVDGEEIADIEVQRHVAACLRCQAELVQYRKVLRTLHQLRTEVFDPAPGLLPDILAAIEAAGERRAMHHLLNGRRVAYVGGIAAATAAGAAGAILANRARHRRVRLAS